MPKFGLAPVAGQGIDSILAWTEERFDEQARLRYEALLLQAITDITNRPDLPSSQSEGRSRRPAAPIIFHSRNHAAVAVGRVRRPRHFVLYRTRSDGIVEIGRELHDSMDLERHLPDEYRSRSGGDELQETAS
jgi:toxin ParE1/3/4